MIRKLLLVTARVSLLLFLMNNVSYSQAEHVLQENMQYKIYYVTGICEVASELQPFEFGFIRINNLSNDSITVSFNIVTRFDEGCMGCNSEDESYFQTKLAPYEQLNTDCSTDTKLKLYFNNPNFLGAWHFRSLSITNLNVN